MAGLVRMFTAAWSDGDAHEGGGVSLHPVEEIHLMRFRLQKMFGFIHNCWCYFFFFSACSSMLQMIRNFPAEGNSANGFVTLSHLELPCVQVGKL